MSKLQEYDTLIHTHLTRILQLDLHDIDAFYVEFEAMFEVIMAALDQGLFEQGFGIGDTVLDAMISIITSDTFYLRTKEDPTVYGIFHPIMETLTTIASKCQPIETYSFEKIRIFLLSILAFIKSEPAIDSLEMAITLFYAMVREKPALFKHETLLFSNYIADYFEDSEDIRFFTMIIIGSIGQHLNAVDLALTDIDYASTIEIILTYIKNKGYDNEETNYWYAIKFIGDILRVLCDISDPKLDQHAYSAELKTDVTDAFIRAILTRFLAILQHQELQFPHTIALALDDEIRACGNAEEVKTNIEPTKGHMLLTLVTDRFTRFIDNTIAMKL